MKKKIIKFIAVIVIAVLAIGNGTAIVDSSSNDISLNDLAATNTAQAEDVYGNYYLVFVTGNLIMCYSGGYFACN
jgi:hypothetical protein